MEESPQIITLNHILIAADFPAQLRTFPRSSVFSRSNSAARSLLWTDLYYAANAVKCTEPEELDRDELIARRTELLEKEYGKNESNE